MRFETPRLLLFLFRTRFSREFLILLTLFMFFTAILPRYFPPDIHRLFSSQGRYTFAFATATNGMRGGFLILKSDRDFLFFLPISIEKIWACLITIQFFSYAVPFIILQEFFGTTGAEAFTAALLSTGLSVVPFEEKRRLVLSAITSSSLFISSVLPSFSPLSPNTPVGFVLAAFATTLLLKRAYTTAVNKPYTVFFFDKKSAKDVPLRSFGLKAVRELSAKSVQIAGSFSVSPLPGEVLSTTSTTLLVFFSGAAALIAAFPEKLVLFFIPEVAVSLAFFIASASAVLERTWIAPRLFEAREYVGALIGGKVEALQLAFTLPALVSLIEFVVTKNVPALGCFTSFFILIPYATIWFYYFTLKSKRDQSTVRRALNAVPFTLTVAFVTLAEQSILGDVLTTAIGYLSYTLLLRCAHWEKLLRF